MQNDTIKEQITAQAHHVSDALHSLRDRLTRVQQVATGYTHKTEDAAKAAKHAIAATLLHAEAIEEKLAEFLKEHI